LWRGRSRAFSKLERIKKETFMLQGTGRREKEGEKVGPSSSSRRERSALGYKKRGDYGELERMTSKNEREEGEITGDFLRGKGENGEEGKVVSISCQRRSGRKGSRKHQLSREAGRRGKENRVEIKIKTSCTVTRVGGSRTEGINEGERPEKERGNCVAASALKKPMGNPPRKPTVCLTAFRKRECTKVTFSRKRIAPRTKLGTGLFVPSFEKWNHGERVAIFGKKRKKIRKRGAAALDRKLRGLEEVLLPRNEACGEEKQQKLLERTGGRGLLETERRDRSRSSERMLVFDGKGLW